MEPAAAACGATEPLALTIAVLVFGAVARLMRRTFDRWIERLLGVMSAHWICFILTVALGLLSSVITAVVAALVLVEAISLLNLDRKSEIAAVVLACFTIGLGAALTPVGEPLGTIQPPLSMRTSGICFGCSDGWWSREY